MGGASSATGDAAWIVGEWASERVRAGIEASLATLGVRFDVWKSEGSLYREGWVERAVERLRASGHLYEQDGALWFRSTDYGDDKDRVVRKSNGDYTYFGSDIGYVVEKFSRGFDHLVYIWGADHHGTVARLRNAAAAMGFDREAVQMILMAWVRFVRDGVEVSMSKRAGEFITLDDLLAEIGVDAARWFFAARGYTSGIDFDIELAKKQSNENPVYYVQYAHARIASILRKAAEAGLEPGGRRGAGIVRRGRLDAGGGAGAGARALPRGGGGRGRRRGDAGRHRLRHGARDTVPRLLPRRARRRHVRAGALALAAGARAGDAAHAGRTRWTSWGSRRPRRCRWAAGVVPGSCRGRPPCAVRRPMTDKDDMARTCPPAMPRQSSRRRREI